MVSLVKDRHDAKHWLLITRQSDSRTPITTESQNQMKRVSVLNASPKFTQSVYSIYGLQIEKDGHCKDNNIQWL